MRKLAIGFILVGLTLAASAQTDSQRLALATYDPLFERWATRWMPEYEWRWLKAQCYQESRFQPRAVSPAGARGICQLMPGTARDLGVSDPFNAAQNIRGGAQYMRRMLNIWVWERTHHQRLELAQASYNAGAGNILAAQRECGGAITWSDIRQCLPAVTGHHAAETIGYVRNIRRWYRSMTCSSD